MAVTDQLSTQETARTDGTTPPQFKTIEQYGKLRIATFDFTQSGAGDANSTVNLRKLPAGRVRVFGSLSKVYTSAFGSSRTLDIGHRAYKARTDGSAVAEDDDELHSAADVSSAGSFNPTDEEAAGFTDFDSDNGVILFATVEGGTIPDAATIKGYFVYAVE